MAIVRHKTTNDLYLYLGNNTFRNLRTGVEGNVSDEVAQRSFAINIDATEIIMKHPIVEELIKTLNLKMEKDGVASV